MILRQHSRNDLSVLVIINIPQRIHDYHSSQLQLTQARLSQSQAVYNFVVAKSNLEKTIGCDFIDEKGETDLERM